MSARPYPTAAGLFGLSRSSAANPTSLPLHALESDVLQLTFNFNLRPYNKLNNIDAHITSKGGRLTKPVMNEALKDLAELSSVVGNGRNHITCSAARTLSRPHLVVCLNHPVPASLPHVAFNSRVEGANVLIDVLSVYCRALA